MSVTAMGSWFLYYALFNVGYRVVLHLAMYYDYKVLKVT